MKFLPILIALLLLTGCLWSPLWEHTPTIGKNVQPVKSQQLPTDPRLVTSASTAQLTAVNPCHGQAIIVPTSWGYTWTNPCNATFGAGTNGVTVTEIQTHPLKGPHQFATSLAGPWSIPASNSYVWKWSGPYKHSPMYFKGPPGAVTIISYWSRTNVPEVSYLVANS